ncbi:MAG TPA: 3,5-dihydroxyphenylacetyl-CoA synthase DpgA [Actinocrinis sp.]|uniref:3,5-dihydroxyphenylacetyl-CoA synthase DpgA n=1 Tax=Actinocrinis sp. TaxID=1920516 RepID=UPI002DDDBC48|nr:3,5-dihydroxyphenylacetyl-CoA synthase DpgA [Actinocrinis sp.]HEV2343302.1 3,5-dihydroxyphenylacetyl-CoA synthase DpgA [Actinocrinis sp.]
MTSQPVRLLSVGTAVPPDSYTQAELLDEFQIADSRIRSLFLNSAIDRRNLVLPPVGPDGGRRMETQGELLRKHTISGLEMGEAAIRSCLARTGAELDDVAYLCCVSSTGFITPGFSAKLIARLGLAPTCSRLDVIGMGCNAGLNALNSVVGWARMNPGRLALMACIEVCSAAYVFDGTMRTAVVNGLFGDGAAAVALSQPAPGDPAVDREVGPSVLKFSSLIIPDAIDAMRYDWDEDQGRFSFFLHPDVPYEVGAHAGPALERLLAGTGLHRSDVKHWLVHSGGKKVIDAVRVDLGLSRYDVRHTTSVLREHGNLSSGSFLFSYDRLLGEGLAEHGDHGVMMTMGPGSTIEMALLQW